MKNTKISESGHHDGAMSRKNDEEEATRNRKTGESGHYRKTGAMSSKNRKTGATRSRKSNEEEAIRNRKTGESGHYEESTSRRKTIECAHCDGAMSRKGDGAMSSRKSIEEEATRNRKAGEKIIECAHCDGAMCSRKTIESGSFDEAESPRKPNETSTTKTRPDSFSDEFNLNRKTSETSIERGRSVSPYKVVFGSSKSNYTRRGTPWSEDEHRAFLIGLEELGKGNWKEIARDYVPTRTPTQVASHAQKHFNRLSAKRNRRSSVFDLTLDPVDETPTPSNADESSNPANKSDPVVHTSPERPPPLSQIPIPLSQIPIFYQGQGNNTTDTGMPTVGWVPVLNYSSNGQSVFLPILPQPSTANKDELDHQQSNKASS